MTGRIWVRIPGGKRVERFSKEGTAQGLRSVETTRGFRHRTVATAP